LGSGSACRSLKGKLVLWGELENIAGSSNLYGSDLSHLLHADFREYQDVILLVDKGEKAVSSSLGHELMNNHPFAEARFRMAQYNCIKLMEVLKSGDIDAFVELCEAEALTLHALMMSSSPGYVLMKPNTLSIINAVRLFRHETKLPVCFTLDAGANVHLLFPISIQSKVLEFINNQLVCYCQNQSYICDSVGDGASKCLITSNSSKY
ncbi:MAG: diphosphomevalonate decarboxylase, partial [Flavobacteriaceae bacterium]|nr:diphosphomevalonate decarboxylase [Flavobacteriaceae bacterium]